MEIEVSTRKNEALPENGFFSPIINFFRPPHISCASTKMKQPIKVKLGRLIPKNS